MSGRAEPRIVAEIGGLVIAEDGPLVVIIDRRTGPWATVAFVLGVVALVIGGFGAVTLTLPMADGTTVPGWLGTMLLLVGMVFAGASAATVVRIRRAGAKALDGYRPVATFDRSRRVFVDAAGDVVAPLDHVRFDTRTQLASSSPMLVAVTPGGTRILKRGNPFNGGLGNAQAVLEALVFAPTR